MSGFNVFTPVCASPTTEGENLTGALGSPELWAPVRSRVRNPFEGGTCAEVQMCIEWRQRAVITR